MYNPNILVITETWTNDAISNDYLNINGYDVIERKDRNDTKEGHGGGIIVYVKKTMCAWREECDTVFNQCGMIGVKMNGGDLHVLSVYIGRLTLPRRTTMNYVNTSRE